MSELEQTPLPDAARCAGHSRDTNLDKGGDVRVLITCILLTLVGPQASAGFGSKSMQEPLPAREIERPLAMSRGWLEFGFGYDHHVGTGAWSADGQVEKFNDAKWNYLTTSLNLRYGLTNRVELWWYMPVHYAHLSNDVLGTDIRDMSIGDPRFGYRLELYRGDGPLTSVVFEAAYKGPAADEAPGSYIGGPNNISGFVFTTGTPDISAGFAGKRQLGPVALTASARYVYRFSAVAQYLVELDRGQFSGRIKPGDLVQGELDVMLQAGPVAISVTPEFTLRQLTKLGTTGSGFLANNQLAPLADSDGMALDLRAQLMLQPTRGVDLILYGVLPLVGEDLQFFPIEDLQPTYGPTFGGIVEARY